MADQEPASEADQPTTAISKLIVPEIIDFNVIRNEMAPEIDRIITHANTTVAKLAVGIKDDETMALAVKEAEFLRDNGQDLLKKWREEFYMEKWYRPGEEVRDFFDSRLKPIAAHMKTLLGHVSDYKGKKEREAKLARERAEAEARRQREEAERKQREAEEAERRAKEAAEAEKRRIKEAQEAEERRIQAEKELKERQEREARESAAKETQRKLKEEEDARMRHAEVAHEEGSGAAKVDTILESATPISPVLGGASAQVKDMETLRLERENATRVAEEKLLKEEAEKAAAEKRRKEAEAEAFRAREEATAATAAATAAAAAAAAASIPPKTESGTTGTVRWIWDLESDGSVDGDRNAIIAVLRGVVEALDGKMQLPPGFDPLTFIGYDEKHPEDFRPSAITKRVTEDKDRFRWPGIRAYPQQDERLKRRVVGGRR